MTQTHKNPSFNTTLNFIKEAHEGQVYGGQPYWVHPLTVANILTVRFTDSTDEERLAALLHDVIEDTRYTADDLLAWGYSQVVVEIVKLLSRDKKKTTYVEFIQSIADSGNIGAIKVKIADNSANSLPQNVESLPLEKRSIVTRYEKAIAVLELALLNIERLA